MTFDRPWQLDRSGKSSVSGSKSMQNLLEEKRIKNVLVESAVDLFATRKNRRTRYFSKIQKDEEIVMNHFLRPQGILCAIMPSKRFEEINEEFYHSRCRSCLR